MLLSSQNTLSLGGPSGRPQQHAVVCGLRFAAPLRIQQQVPQQRLQRDVQARAVIPRRTVVEAGPQVAVARQSSDQDEPEVKQDTKQVYLVLYLGLSALAMVVGYTLHPILLEITATAWHIKPAADDFESSFFGLLSIVYSVFAGQTFLFLYERQINIVQELYGEVFALEIMVQQTFLMCQNAELRVRMAQSLRAYMEEEVYTPVDMESPFSSQSPYMDILDVLIAMQDKGIQISGLVDASKQLADAQNRRSAMAASILPVVHWVFMHGLELIFVFTFLVFDASELDMTAADAFSRIPEERRLFFGALFGLLALTTQILKDLDDPISGLYSFRSALNERVQFLEKMLNMLEDMPPSHVPKSVVTLMRLGLIGGSSQGSPGAGNQTNLTVPTTGARRRRGRSRRSGIKWGQHMHHW